MVFLTKSKISLMEKTSDLQIISLLAVNSILAWDQLYDKYAAPMYGLICKLTDDKLLAEEIFTTAFVELKEKKVLNNVKNKLSIALLSYTFSYTTKHLRGIGITPKSLLQVIGSRNTQSTVVPSM